MDDTLAAAFETIQREVGFDMLSTLPHPENIRFKLRLETQVMQRLGMKLVDIVGSQDNDDLHYAAHVIRRYFGDALGMKPAPEFMADVPRFLISPDSRTTNRTDPQQLAQHLGQLALPQEDVICFVSTNLARLQKLLYLSDAEISFLKLAYAVSSQHERVHSLSCCIAMALGHISVLDDAHQARAIALLLGLPLDDVNKMLAPPCRLKALRFVDTVHTNGKPNVRAAFVLTDAFMELLECNFKSHTALLHALLEPEIDLDLRYDEEIPVGQLYEDWPKALAEAFECAVLSRPLKSHHIDTLVRWYTGGYKLHPAQYTPLAGRISVEGVRDAVKQAAFDSCLSDAPLDGFALMRALYVSATTICQRSKATNTTEIY